MKVLFFDAARKTLEPAVVDADSPDDELATVRAINGMIGSRFFEALPTPFQQHVLLVDEEGALKACSQEPWVFKSPLGQVMLCGNAVVCVDDGYEMRDATVSPSEFCTCIDVCASATRSEIIDVPLA